MKKLRTILLFTISFFVLYCSDSGTSFTENEKIMYRTAAFNYLSEEEKETIISNLNEAPVGNAKFSLNESGGPGIILEGTTATIPYITPMSSLMAEGTPLVTVTFNTTNDPLLGPIVVILLEDATPIGFLPRL